MTPDAVHDRDRANDAVHDEPLRHATRDATLRVDTAPDPWNRMLGILVLGSFAAAAKAAREGCRPIRRRDPSEAAA